MSRTSRLLAALLPGRRSLPEAGAAEARFVARRAAPAKAAGPAPEGKAKVAAKTKVIRLRPADGARRAPTLEAFTALSVREDVPGAPRVRAVKFLMTGVDGARPKLFLVQSNRYFYHHDFATEALGMGLSLEDFNARTYFRDQRENLAGTLLYHESYVARDGQVGLVAIEFWPTDPVHARHVTLAFRALRAALPFARGRIAYHPAGSTQEALYAEEAGALKKARVSGITSAELFAGVTFTPMNLGVSFGTLRVVDAAAAGSRPPTARDVVVLEQSPNDLSHVAGILTESPQTPLSHINLKAKQNGTPNAYLKDASSAPDVIANRDKVIRFEVAPGGVHITPATPAEAQAFLDQARPQSPQTPPRNLDEKSPRPLAALGFADARTFGAKAANVAELRKVLAGKTVPDGFALPFSFYDRFMAETGLYDAARKMIAGAAFRDDPAVREQKLTELRKKVKKATMPAALVSAIGALQQAFQGSLGAAQPIRARSSTNNEDLPGFNGAGLYDSFTHRPDEGHLESTVKQVFASLWNFRAFEERDFYRVDHFVAAMGVLLHPNEDDERANGVAYTKNIYDPSWPGFYINAQVGESLVTNPDPGAKPEEFLISRIGEHGEYETQYISRSSLAAAGEPVLQKLDVDALVRALEKLQPHFQRLYGRVGDKTFAMDVEFKVRKDGSLQIKQARPTVD